MKKTFLKILSLVFVVIFAASCLTSTAFAADEQVPENESMIITLARIIFGDEAIVDGKIDMGVVAHVLYYKDSPLMLKFLDMLYDAFWGIVMFIVNNFVEA